MPELASRIVEECTWTPKILAAADKEGLRTLYSLARTCHTLLEPALDMIWYRQDTLAHVIKTLPDDLWVMAEVNVAGLVAYKELVSRNFSVPRHILNTHNCVLFRDSHTRDPLIQTIGHVLTSTRVGYVRFTRTNPMARAPHIVHGTCWTRYAN